MRVAVIVLFFAGVLTTPVSWAKPKSAPLSEATAATLAGKTLAVTRRGEKPSFIAATAGKAGFGLFGAGAMVAAGNQIVRDNNIADPSDTVEAQLVPALVKQFGVRLLPGGGRAITPGNHLNEIIGASPGADLILDIRSIGWNFNYYPTHWGTYWVGWGVQVQLIDVKSGTVLSDMPCSGNTIKNSAAPSKEALLENGAQLLKDTLAGISWTCSRLLAQDQFRVTPENQPQIPPELTDPLASYAAQHGGAAPATPAATSAPISMPAPPDSPAATQAAAPESNAATPTSADH
jgi:hypothetical protein